MYSTKNFLIGLLVAIVIAALIGLAVESTGRLVTHNVAKQIEPPTLYMQLGASQIESRQDYLVGLGDRGNETLLRAADGRALWFRYLGKNWRGDPQFQCANNFALGDPCMEKSSSGVTFLSGDEPIASQEGETIYVTGGWKLVEEVRPAPTYPPFPQ